MEGILVEMKWESEKAPLNHHFNYDTKKLYILDKMSQKAIN